MELDSGELEMLGMEACISTARTGELSMMYILGTRNSRESEERRIMSA